MLAAQHGLPPPHQDSNSTAVIFSYRVPSPFPPRPGPPVGPCTRFNGDSSPSRALTHLRVRCNSGVRSLRSLLLAPSFSPFPPRLSTSRRRRRIPRARSLSARCLHNTSRSTRIARSEPPYRGTSSRNGRRQRLLVRLHLGARQCQIWRCRGASPARLCRRRHHDG